MVDQLDRYNDELAQLNRGVEGASAANLREMSTAIQGMQRAMSQRFASIEVRTRRMGVLDFASLSCLSVNNRGCHENEGACGG